MFPSTFALLACCLNSISAADICGVIRSHGVFCLTRPGSAPTCSCSRTLSEFELHRMVRPWRCYYGCKASDHGKPKEARCPERSKTGHDRFRQDARLPCTSDQLSVRKAAMVERIRGDALWSAKESDDIFTAHVGAYSGDPISRNTMWHEVNDKTCRYGEHPYKQHHPVVAGLFYGRVQDALDSRSN